ncbi:hypothetical protein RFI_34084 [Reticulomyxa filosa]|uniref:Uncharacterized protein n=1 Tax=Reticulomyxa filosa TaxID=46433 RepID=X6LPN1_RETFI|nr:hypothetical protein RFI_34084 [Reticulomyxa filosa]|eukprot:ETO03326.1 hypothetical protein RFI_34084 [Reticulomyxa filosa]
MSFLFGCFASFIKRKKIIEYGVRPPVSARSTNGLVYIDTLFFFDVIDFVCSLINSRNPSVQKTNKPYTSHSQLPTKKNFGVEATPRRQKNERVCFFYLYFFLSDICGPRDKKGFEVYFFFNIFYFYLMLSDCEHWGGKKINGKMGKRWNWKKGKSKCVNGENKWGKLGNKIGEIDDNEKNKEKKKKNKKAKKKRKIKKKKEKKKRKNEIEEKKWINWKKKNWRSLFTHASGALEFSTMSLLHIKSTGESS